MKKKFDKFVTEDDKSVSVAYLNGYDFGDRILEGVPFRVEVIRSGDLRIRFAYPSGEYEKGLNQKYWCRLAMKHAQGIPEDEFEFFVDAEMSGLTAALKRRRSA